MVDVGAKLPTAREAVAEGYVHLSSAAMSAVIERTAKKGDVLTVAQIAGIQGAKRTAETIPLCHPLALSGVDVTFDPQPEQHRIRCEARVRTTGQTGVEMEALCAVNAALLTIYDMLKAVDRGMTLNGIALISKTGGRSGEWRRNG